MHSYVGAVSSKSKNKLDWHNDLPTNVMHPMVSINVVNGVEETLKRCRIVLVEHVY
jgi:hypothetical protein